MKHFIIALAAFLFFIPPLQAGSDYYVGCVDDYKGEVKVFKPLRNLWIPAKKLIPIEENDTIKTGTLSNCRLLFDDGSCVSIDANTQLMMESLKLNKTPQGRVQAYEMKLSFGSMLAVFSKLKSKDAKFRLKTPNAVMSVRGTDICLKASATDSKIAVFEGEVAVSMKNEENQSILKPGQEASIIKNSEPVTQS